MDRDLVSFPVRFLYRRIIRVFVRYEKRGFDVAPVRISALAVEYLFVQFDVVVVDGVVESDRDHLRHFFVRQVVGYSGTVFGTETVGQNAHGRVAGRRAIRVVVVIYTRRRCGNIRLFYFAVKSLVSNKIWNKKKKNIFILNNRYGWIDSPFVGDELSKT